MNTRVILWIDTAAFNYLALIPVATLLAITQMIMPLGKLLALGDLHGQGKIHELGIQIPKLGMLHVWPV